jgi:hypothetical protein
MATKPNPTTVKQRLEERLRLLPAMSPEERTKAEQRLLVEAMAEVRAAEETALRSERAKKAWAFRKANP